MIMTKITENLQKKESFQQAIVILPSQLSDEAAEDLRLYWFRTERKIIVVEYIG